MERLTTKRKDGRWAIRNDEYREYFMELVYDLLQSDGTNDRANQIIDAFDMDQSVEAEPLPPNDPMALEELREMDGEHSEGVIKLHSAIHGDGAYEEFKRIASDFYTNHTYKFVALTLDREPRPDIVTFTAEFWRVPNGVETPPPNAPLTLEQLREMDGEPVWVERHGYGKHWALVHVWAKSTNIIYLICNNGMVMHPQPELESGAKIYRRKPEEGQT